MESPEEIKKALKCRSNLWYCTLHGCTYYRDKISMCSQNVAHDALDYIQQLENHIGELTEKVAQIKTEHQNLICDFMDYINDGIPNPAPYCAFGESCVLVDKRGWCRHGEYGCSGFVPRVRDDNENV